METSLSHSAISINSKSQNVPFRALALAYSPPETIKHNMGELFICLEAPKGIIKSLVQGAGKAFYNSKLQSDAEQRFQDSIKALNEILATLPKENISIGIIALHKQAIYYSACNSYNVMLLRQGSITNLAEDTDPKFSQIGFGQLKNNDIVVVGSNAFHRKPMSEVFNKLEDGPNDVFKDNLHRIAAEAELDRLALITVWLNDNIDDIGQATTKSYPQDKNKVDPSPSNKNASLFKNITAQLIKAIQKIRKQYLPAFLRFTKKWWTNSWTKYVNPNPKKAFIVVIIATIIIFIILWTLISSVKSTSTSEKALINAQALIDSADKAESSNNQDSAKKYLAQASSTLKGISEKDQNLLNSLYNSKKLKVSYSEQMNRLQAILDRTQSVKRIKDTNSFDIGVSNLAYMSYLGSKLLALDKNNGNLIEINPLFGAPAVKTSSTEIKSAVGIAPASDNLLILTPLSIFQYDGSPNLTQLKVVGLPESSAINTYLNYVYLLSPKENQVVRFNKSSTSLFAKTNLLRNLAPEKFKGSTSMVVFGAIFVPSSNNILAFEQGEERTFKLRDMPESFGGIKSLTYNPIKNYFVALNSQSNRLAILQLDSDSATFKNSYALQNDANISSFAIDNNTSQIFVNSGSKLYSFNLEKM